MRRAASHGCAALLRRVDRYPLMSSYTLEDHARAAEALSLLRAKENNYSGNNPNKFRADIERARATLIAIELALKEDGTLQRLSLIHI